MEKEPSKVSDPLNFPAGHLWARAYLAQGHYENWGYELITYPDEQKTPEMYVQLREYIREWTQLKSDAWAKEEECNSI